MPALDRCAATFGRCEDAATRCVRRAGHEGMHAAVIGAGVRGRVAWPDDNDSRTTAREMETSR